MESPKVTLKEIARLSGVSMGTVDRALNDRKDVSEETKKKIQLIAKDLGYKPNIYARSLSSKQKTTVAIVIPLYSEARSYWQQPMEGIQKALEELHLLGLQTFNFLFDLANEDTFREVSEKVLELSPDAIILSPYFQKQASLFVEACKKKGIILVCIDSKLDDGKTEYFIGQDAYQSGYLAAKLMSNIVPDSTQVLILKIFDQHQRTGNLQPRILGFEDFFESRKSEKNITIKEIQVADTESLDGTVIEDLLTRNTNISGVFVPNSRAFVMARFLEEKNIRNLRLIGYDLLPQNIQYLETEWIDFLIGQRPQEQGYKVVKTLFNSLVLKKNLEVEQLMPIDIITKENLSYYINYK